MINFTRFDTFMMGWLLGWICSGLLLVFIATEDRTIMSQKSFIIGNATYQCTKTNELKEGNSEQTTTK